MMTGIFHIAEKKINLERLKQLAQKPPKVYPYVPISSLTLKEVEKCMKLKSTTEMDLELYQFIAPVDLCDAHSNVLKSCQVAFAKDEKELARLTLGLLLGYANKIVSSNAKVVRPLNFGTNGCIWKFGSVTLRRMKSILWGRPDYHLWYGKRANTAVNVVVVQSKGPGTGIAQALCYMGKFLYS
ncbi:hypothetical protein N7495_003792 [Penicillium taxi]|uniref:uncharacterized protein n=1 Tax=Penicillium taxi TaxID=168475 RepID=UPI0025455BEB|nr:uncharacterized protein N7495_003792 [Penicillium taxi]KAJ5899048.1 hypothetical protein N7495_003792 [Penicillium taxi]